MTWPIVGLAASFLALAYVYGGYLGVLRLLIRLRGGRRGRGPESRGAAEVSDRELPGVTVFISAYNEADRIRPRIDDLLEQDFPPDRLEIVVISDGSTDGTDEEVRLAIRENPGRDIRLIAFEENRGRAVAQNLMPEEARHDILLSTDADTVFAENCLRRLIEPFVEPNVGVVGGTLVYRDVGSEISDSIQDYWGYELALREAEQELGVLTKVSGPCVAYRKRLWRPIEDFEDVDRVVVFFARQEGLRAVHAHEARCFDTPNHHWRQELRVRRRMTRKGILTISNRWGWREAFADPLFTFCLWSHKVARYPTPLYSLLGVASGAALLSQSLGFPAAAVTLALLALGLAAAAITPSGPGRWLAARVKSFILANIGFAWGWLDVLSGNREGRYKPTRQLVTEEGARSQAD